MPQKSAVLTAMTYLHIPLPEYYYQRWRVLRFCSEWKEVVPRRSNDRQHSAILQIVKCNRTLESEEKVGQTNQNRNKTKLGSVSSMPYGTYTADLYTWSSATSLYPRPCGPEMISYLG